MTCTTLPEIVGPVFVMSLETTTRISVAACSLQLGGNEMRGRRD